MSNIEMPEIGGFREDKRASRQKARESYLNVILDHWQDPLRSSRNKVVIEDIAAREPV